MTLSARQRITLAQQQRPHRTVATTHILKLLQAWQGFSIDELIAACQQYGFTGVLVKALDGADWMATFDDSADAIHGVEDVASQAARFRAAGLYYFAWTVPKDQGDIALQATLSGQVARACDGLFLDVEPYASFWGPERPVGDAAQFMTWLRAEAPNAFIALQPDPRPNALLEIRDQEWLANCDALAGQHYWSDFGSTSLNELVYAVQLGQQLGVPILPTLPGNAGLTSFDMRLVAQLPGFIVWRWGTIPQNTLEALGSVQPIGFTSARIPAR